MGIKKPSANEEAILEALGQESPRGCVLVGTAWVEDRLRRLVASQLQLLTVCGPGKDKVRDKAISDVLGDVTVMGSARSQTKFCRAAGLIDEHIQKALENLGVLRNHFAHWAGPGDLDDPDVKQAMKNFLDVPFAPPREWDSSLERMGGTRVLFEDRITMLAMALIQNENDLLEREVKVRRLIKKAAGK